MTAKEMFEIIEQLIKQTSKMGSFTIDYNDHKSCYENPIDYYNLDEEEVKINEDVDWNKDIFNLHWYKDTPVGFYRLFSNTLNGLLEKTLELMKELGWIE